MLAQLSPRQLTEHMASAQLEPFGWRQLGSMFAKLISTLYATAGVSTDEGDLLLQLGFPTPAVIGPPLTAEEAEEAEEAAINRSVLLGKAAFG